MSFLNPDARKMLYKSGQFRALPAPVRAALIRAQLSAKLRENDVELSFIVGALRNVLPPDARVEATYNAFVEEFFRWWKDGGGQ
jgi:hypothetical protein